MKLKHLAALSLAAVCTFGLAACKPAENDNPPVTDNPPVIDNPPVKDYGLIYALSADGQSYSCNGTDGETAEIEIAAEYNGKPVTEIADGAFEGNTFVTSVIIPDSVTEIGERAFYGCGSLERITLGAGLVSSGGSAFGRCFSLESVYVSDVAAFADTEFENFAANPLYFAKKLYEGDTLVTEIEITDGTVGDFAFYGYPLLTSVTVGGGAEYIGVSAFERCENLGSVAIGGEVAVISDSAFLGCAALTELEIGEKVEAIGGYAFSECSSLTEATVPASVKTIGECAFASCALLETLNLNYGLEYIGEAAFGGCYALEGFVMPDSVKEIGFGVLMFGGEFGFGEVIPGDNNLKTLVLSGELTEIPQYAFNGCSMTEIKIGGKVTFVGYSAFYGCLYLETVIIPKSVKRIESFAFYRLQSLQSVFYEGTEAEWNDRNVIRIGANGNEFTAENTYFYSETRPAEEGNFWHYVNGEAVKW